MKRITEIFKRIIGNPYISGTAVLIGSVAALIWSWETVDSLLGISRFFQASSVSESWNRLDIPKRTQNDWVQAGAVILTYLGGFAAIGYLCEKFFPYFREGVCRMKDKLPQKVPLEIPEGQVPLCSPFYVERPPIERDCYEAVSRPDALIRIKAPRQMGKTSLMTRVLDYAEHQGCRIVSVYFQQAETEIFADLNLFLQWFCASVSSGLNLEDKVETYWKGILGSKNKASDYFQKYLLPEAEEPLAIGLDEVDLIFEHPKIASDFFALLRAWHERGKNEDVWKKLKLVIVHSQEVYIPLNINQSPFNVGFPVELPELTRKQTKDLAARHGISVPDEPLQVMINMLGGHPYLLRAAMYHLARRRISFKKLLKTAPTEQGPYADHLRRHLANLRNDKKLLAAMKKVIESDSAVKIGEVETFKLRSLGLVKFRGDGNAVAPLCDLYRIYFRERLN